MKYKVFQLICVNNGDNEGTLSVAELPFSTQVLDGVTSFIPSGKPIDLSTPWGLAFVSLLSAQPAWIKCRYISRNDFLFRPKKELAKQNRDFESGVRFSGSARSTCSSKEVRIKGVTQTDLS